MATTCLWTGQRRPAEAVRAHAEDWYGTSFPRLALRTPGSFAACWPTPAPASPTSQPDAARQAVAEIVAGAPDVLGLDFETEVLPAFRQPIPIKFNGTETSPSDSRATVPPASRSTPIVPRFGSSKPVRAVSTSTSSICGP